MNLPSWVIDNHCSEVCLTWAILDIVQSTRDVLYPNVQMFCSVMVILTMQDYLYIAILVKKANSSSGVSTLKSFYVFMLSNSPLCDFNLQHQQGINHFKDGCPEK